MSTYHGRRHEVVRYGPDVPAEDELRLLPDLAGTRVLELGSGSRSSAVALAKQGAHVIVVDPHPERLAEARSVAEDEEARAEWHENAFVELAFLRAESIDVVLSAGAVLEVEDLGRLLRQVHRVLGASGVFVFSYEHPLVHVAEGRSYFDETPLPRQVDGVDVSIHPRSISAVFTDLHRTGYRVEMLAEPRPLSGADRPTTVVWRARKEGL